MEQELTTRRFAVFLLVVVTVSAAAAQFLLIRARSFTQKEYDLIAIGMDEEEVYALIGAPRSYRYDTGTEHEWFSRFSRYGSVIATESSPESGALSNLNFGWSGARTESWLTEESAVFVGFNQKKVVAKSLVEMNPSANEPALSEWFRRLRNW